MKHLHLVHIFTAVFALTLLPLQGQEGAPSRAGSRIAQFSASVTGIECDFVQSRHSPMLEEAAVSKGHMTYRKPDFLKWEYFYPFSFSLVADKGTVFTQRDGVRGKADSRLDKIYREMSKLIVGSIDGSVITDSRLFRTEFSEADGITAASLIPVRADMKSMWSKLVVTYDSKSCKAVSFALYEVSGDYTLIEFHNSKYEISE